MARDGPSLAADMRLDPERADVMENGLPGVRVQSRAFSLLHGFLKPSPDLPIRRADDVISVGGGHVLARGNWAATGRRMTGWIPAGGGLRHEDWARRHRLLTLVLAA